MKVSFSQRFFPRPLLWWISVASPSHASHLPFFSSRYSLLTLLYSMLRFLSLAETGLSFPPLFLNPLLALSGVLRLSIELLFSRCVVFSVWISRMSRSGLSSYQSPQSCHPNHGQTSQAHYGSRADTNQTFSVHYA